MRTPACDAISRDVRRRSGLRDATGLGGAWSAEIKLDGPLHYGRSVVWTGSGDKRDMRNDALRIMKQYEGHVISAVLKGPSGQAETLT